MRRVLRFLRKDGAEGAEGELCASILQVCVRSLERQAVMELGQGGFALSVTFRLQMLRSCGFCSLSIRIVPSVAL